MLKPMLIFNQENAVHETPGNQLHCGKNYCIKPSYAVKVKPESRDGLERTFMTDSIIDAIGNTPVVEIQRINPVPGVRIFAKLEYMNPGGPSKTGPRCL